MTVCPFMLRGFAVAAWAVIATSMPVLAEASWIRPSCGHAPCPDGLYGVSLTISNGWERHPSKNPQVMILVPNGGCFYCESRGPFIELTVELNSENKSVAEFTEEQQARWRANIPRGTIGRLPDVERIDRRESFQVHQVEDSRGRRFERMAITSEREKRGNTLLVSVILGAGSRRALQGAEPAYLAVLHGFGLE
jgi:hypothetical protein